MATIDTILVTVNSKPVDTVTLNIGPPGEGVAKFLDDLEDVDAGNPSDNDAILFNETTQNWESKPIGGGAPHSLGSHTNVAASVDSASNTQALAYDMASGNWVNKFPEAGKTESDFQLYYAVPPTGFPGDGRIQYQAADNTVDFATITTIYWSYTDENGADLKNVMADMKTGHKITITENGREDYWQLTAPPAENDPLQLVLFSVTWLGSVGATPIADGADVRGILNLQGATSNTELVDTPDTYSTRGGATRKVRFDETGLEDVFETPQVALRYADSNPDLPGQPLLDRFYVQLEKAGLLADLRDAAHFRQGQRTAEDPSALESLKGVSLSVGDPNKIALESLGARTDGTGGSWLSWDVDQSISGAFTLAFNVQMPEGNNDVHAVASLQNQGGLATAGMMVRMPDDTVANFAKVYSQQDANVKETSWLGSNLGNETNNDRCLCQFGQIEKNYVLSYDGGTEVKFWADGHPVDINDPTVETITSDLRKVVLGVRETGTLGEEAPMVYTDVAIFGRALTDAEADDLQRIFRILSPATETVVWGGDSRATQLHSADRATGNIAYLYSLKSPQTKVYNAGWNGAQVSAILADIDNLLLRHYPISDHITRARMVFHGAANDILAGRTASAIWTDLQEIARRCREVGYHVTLCTEPEPADGYYDAAQETERRALNKLIRDGASENVYDWLADFEVLNGQSTGGEPNGNWFDELHWWNPGNDVAASYIKSGTIDRHTAQTLEEADPVTWDASLGRLAKLGLTADRPLAMPTNIDAGKLTLQVNQDHVGGHQLTWPSGFVGDLPTLSTWPDVADVLTFHTDGRRIWTDHVARPAKPPTVKKNDGQDDWDGFADIELPTSREFRLSWTAERNDQFGKVGFKPGGYPVHDGTWDANMKYVALMWNNGVLQLFLDNVQVHQVSGGYSAGDRLEFRRDGRGNISFWLGGEWQYTYATPDTADQFGSMLFFGQEREATEIVVSGSGAKLLNVAPNMLVTYPLDAETVLNDTMVLRDETGAECGALGLTTAERAAYFTHSNEFSVSRSPIPGDGGLKLDSGLFEAFGEVMRIDGLADDSTTEGRNVEVSPSGYIYATAKPPPTQVENYTDANDYDLGTGTTPGPWVPVADLAATGFSVSPGEEFRLNYSLQATNKTGNRAGTIATGFGLNGADPATVSNRHAIVEGFADRVSSQIASFSVTLVPGDTVTVFARIESGNNTQFGVDLLGTAEEHTLEAVKPASGGGGGGEANTGANAGLVGEGVFRDKTGVTLNFKRLSSADSSVTITPSGADNVDFSVREDWAEKLAEEPLPASGNPWQSGRHYDGTISADYTISSFGTGAEGDRIRATFQVTSGPVTITLPSVRRVGTDGTTTTFDLSDGNHVITLDYQGGAWFLADSGQDPAAANTIYAGPASGADAAPTFRAMLPDDLPEEAVEINRTDQPTGELKMAVVAALPGTPDANTLYFVT